MKLWERTGVWIVESENPWFSYLENRIRKGIEVPGYRYKIYDKRHATAEWREKFKDAQGEVLDLGCGDRPFTLANILVTDNIDNNFAVPDVDRETKETRCGYTTYLTTEGRRVWVADVSKQILPFVDKSIDFVYASHVYEHVNDPAFALEETMRYGKRGYIGLPDIHWELIYTPFPFDDEGRTGNHQWFIELHNDLVVFRRRDTEEREFTEWRKQQTDEELVLKEYEKFKERYKQTPVIRTDIAEGFQGLFWNDTIRYEVRA